MSLSDSESDDLVRDSESKGSSNEDSMYSSGSESSDSESSSTSDPPHIIHPTVLEPLFEGSSISVFDGHLLIYQFQLKHGLSNRGLEELLQLIKAHTPHTDGLLKSAYALKRFFGELFPDLDSSVHAYCGSCHQPLEGDTSCVRPQCADSTKETFVSVPLQAQLLKRKMEGRPVVLGIRFVYTQTLSSSLLQCHCTHTHTHLPNLGAL